MGVTLKQCNGVSFSRARARRRKLMFHRFSVTGVYNTLFSFGILCNAVVTLWRCRADIGRKAIKNRGLCDG